MIMQQYVLGVDIGTGSTKAVAMDFEAKVLGAVNHHYPTFHPEPGYSEQDPELIWTAFQQCIADTVDSLGAPPVMLSLSSAMHSIIPVDGKGKALGPMMTWADVRSESIATELRGNPELAEQLYKSTGTPIHPMSPLCKLIWLQHDNPQKFKEVAKFISIKDFIWFRLFGHFETDHSIASASGLFDIVALEWNDKACRLAGLEPDQLPLPQPTHFIRKLEGEHLLEQLKLPSGTPVMIGASDGCCANIGTRVNGGRKAALTIGTSGAVRITGTHPVYNPKAMIFNYLLDEHTYVSGGAVNNGGNTVNWMINKLLNINEIKDTDYEQLFKSIASVAAGSEGLLFLPYLHGERAPIWDAQASGAYLNIRNEHGQAHFLRAGLEGICFALKDVLNSIEEASDQVEVLHISGGFTSSEVWVQVLADIIGLPLHLMQVEDASAIGAIYLALRECYPEAYQKLSAQPADKIITPNAENHELYSKKYLNYKQLYAALKPYMHQMN